MKPLLRRAGMLACSTLPASSLWTSAHAQLLLRYLPQSVPGYQLDPTLQILQNGGPDYRSLGVHAGGFVIRPSLDESASYSTNPLGLASAHATPELETAASVSVNSDWSRDSIGASAAVDDQRYTGLPVANQTNTHLFGGGRLDVGRDSLDVSFGRVGGNLEPTDVLTSGLSTPVPYASNDARVSYTIRANRLTIVPTADFATYRFGTARSGSFLIDDHALDKNQPSGGLTATYELAPGRSLVADVSETVAFILHRPTKSAASHYLDTLVLAGFDYDVNTIFRYDILLGYEARSWAGQLRAARRIPAIEVSVTWQPTLLTTVNCAAVRHLSDASYDVDNNLAYSEAKVSTYHELYRAVILTGNFDFQATDGDRQGGGRTVFSAGAGGAWLISRRVRLNLSYQFSHGNIGSLPIVADAPEHAFRDTTETYSTNLIELSVHFGL